MPFSTDSPRLELSVLMPTHNRVEVLQRALHLWCRQPAVREKRVQLIVVDDGSSDGTWALLQSFRDRAGLVMDCTRLEPGRGPAAARNAGLCLIRAPVVLITGDDILPPRGFLSRLLDWHQRHPGDTEALLGRVTWPRALQATPFMRWLEDGGRAFFFDYRDLPAGQPVHPEAFYTCNVSLKTELLRQAGPFDENFPFASHEDLELGCRLQALGMRLFYEPDLLAYHWHPLTLEGAASRVYRMGASTWLYWQRIPPSGSALRRKLRVVLAWLGARPFTVAVRASLLRRLSASRGQNPTGWLLLLFLSFWTGSGAGRYGDLGNTP